MRDVLVPVTEARHRLREILEGLDSSNVILVRHSRPVAVVIDPMRYERLLDYIEDLEDQVSVLTAADEGERIPLEKVKAELGLS
jgi:prevent-host-death family protein